MERPHRRDHDRHKSHHHAASGHPARRQGARGQSCWRRHVGFTTFGDGSLPCQCREPARQHQVSTTARRGNLAARCGARGGDAGQNTFGKIFSSLILRTMWLTHIPGRWQRWRAKPQPRLFSGGITINMLAEYPTTASSPAARWGTWSFSTRISPSRTLPIFSRANGPDHQAVRGGPDPQRSRETFMSPLGPGRYKEMVPQSPKPGSQGLAMRAYAWTMQHLRSYK